MIKLEDLPLPCTLNRLYRSYGGGSKLSKVARERRDLLTATIWDKLGGRPTPMTGAISVQMVVTPRNKRLPDVDAYVKQTLDVLEHAGVIENDKQVVMLNVERLNPQAPGGISLEVYEVGDG